MGRKKIYFFEWRNKCFRQIFLVFGLSLLLVLHSCKKVDVLDCFNSTGKITKVEREIDNFHSIALHDNVNLILKQSGKNKITVEAGSNLIPKIMTRVNEAGILEIRNENTCNWVRSYDKPVNVYLSFVKLDTLFYRSVGDVTNEDTIRMDTLVVEVKEGAGRIALTVITSKMNTNIQYGTADIVTSGFTTLGFIYLAGAGKIDNRNLITQQVYLENRSSNDIYVNSVNTLAAEINSIGNVYYKGNPPDIRLKGTGSGKLIKLE